MNSLFNPDNPLFRFLGRIFDVVYLNLLCLICCIPIITIGPSVTALYYCMLKIARERDSSISGMFFHSFKTDLKQGILLTLIFIGAALFLMVDIQACTLIDHALLEYIKIFLYVLCFVLVVVVSYTFPLLAQFDNTIKNTLKNALLMAIPNFGYTLIIVIFNAIPWVLFFLLPELFLVTFPVWLTFGFSAIAMINSKMFVKIFNKFIPEYQE